MCSTFGAIGALWHQNLIYFTSPNTQKNVMPGAATLSKNLLVKAK
jgi:hypothetical protein